MTDTTCFEPSFLWAGLWSDPDFLQFVMGDPSDFEDADGNEDLDKVVDALDLIMAKYITTEHNPMSNFTSRELELLPQLLNKDRYAGSKDWVSGDMAERVLWLISMYESKEQELGESYEIIGKLSDKIRELRSENV